MTVPTDSIESFDFRLRWGIFPTPAQFANWAPSPQGEGFGCIHVGADAHIGPYGYTSGTAGTIFYGFFRNSTVGSTAVLRNSCKKYIIY